MKEPILEFINGLKFRGARVSISETMDALNGVSVVGVEDRDTFKGALRTTLIKDSKDLPIFEELFDAYFSPLPILSTEKTELEEKLSSLLREMKGDLSDNFINFMEGDPRTMMEMLLFAADEANLQDIRFQIQSGYYFTKMAGALSSMGMERELDTFIDLLEGSGEQDGALGEEDIRGIYEGRLEAMKELIRDAIKREENKHRGEKKDFDIPDNIGERGFSELTENEIEEMREIIKEMVKKMKDALSLRERHMRRGRFDIKRTLRAAQQYGGVPIKVVWKKRKKNKGQIVTLCDVSRSVWNASRFMLNLLYSLQDQFDRVRSFVFVSDLGEVTDCFDRYDINEALNKLIFEAGINFYSYTDYGEVLLKFYREYLDIVNRKTTVIIIGDARNNYMAHNSWALDKIKGKARKVYWLNNEPTNWWGSGDSEMKEFLPYVTEARECRNLKQLSKFIQELIG